MKSVDHKTGSEHRGGERQNQQSEDDGGTLARLKAAAAMPDADINLTDTDAPLVVDWSEAERGRFYRPVKRLKSFRIDADVLAFYESKGKGYQATVNRVLRDAMIREIKPSPGKA